MWVFFFFCDRRSSPFPLQSGCYWQGVSPSSRQGRALNSGLLRETELLSFFCVCGGGGGMLIGQFLEEQTSLNIFMTVLQKKIILLFFLKA